jgi:dimethylargininase
MRGVLERFLSPVQAVSPPGTLDGGDVCEADGHFFIGISQRTNEGGAAQLAAFLSTGGRGSTFVDIRGVAGLLHLKSGAAYLGSGRMVLVGSLANEGAFRGFETLLVPGGEAYAANCVRVNEHVLLAAGYPRMEGLLRQAGCSVLALDMSEFRKMDGGLSCLSLRF